MAKILVIDDNDMDIEMVEFRLESAGHRVIIADSPLGVSALVTKEKPDLALVDLNMPALRGDNVCKVLRKYGLVESTAIVLHSSEDEEKLAQIAVECGADGYIQKGATKEIFFKRLEEYLKKP